MLDKHKKKIRKNFMLSEECLKNLEKLKKHAFPELSYSQIVDVAIIEYAIYQEV